MAASENVIYDYGKYTFKGKNILDADKRRVFNSGLWTIGPHSIILPSVFFSWCWGQIFIRLCIIFWAEQIWGMALLEITVHRQNEP